MHRRSFLLAAGASLPALAGCTAPAAVRRSPGSDGDGGSAAARGDRGSTPDLPVDRDELRRGATKDAIAAITDPAFGDDWEGITIQTRNSVTGSEYEVELSLSPGDRVVGVERDGAARAYPLSVLNYHEVVNDRFGGPLLVSYCPLCGSGVVAERLVGGRPTQFGVSGLLWRDDLVMYDDQTESLWSQLLATAIRGPRTGDRLSLVPSTTTTLGSWRRSHPDTAVLLPPPESKTVNGTLVHDYSFSPYAGYEDSARTGLSGGEFEDERLHPKTRVLGVAVGDRARAYPRPVVAERDVVNDVVGGVPVVVAVAPERSGSEGATGGLVGYDRRIDGELLRFDPGDASTMVAGDSRWDRLTGRAMDGPHEGRQLDRASRRSSMFWFAWLDFYPETDVYGVDAEE